MRALVAVAAVWPLLVEVKAFRTALVVAGWGG
ncbi:hypothetical protein FB382_004363 [Nocardioides ginsengisegetis]|uniref:Uncharacterized protein n=1 Tax=Nocardioides ginsengisegetis TaxID=661491 RepID=A0A7W3PBD0_9ACTN|nr:hypothetical protein [Nocardioides ginsengisegetis]MBA8806012.1 hypothetical protein [Nocardioides ginsengisegetis]